MPNDSDNALNTLSAQRLALIQIQAAIDSKVGSQEEKELAKADLQAKINYLDQRITDINAGGAFTPPTAEEIDALAAATTDLASVIANAALVSELVSAATDIAETYNSDA